MPSTDCLFCKIVRGEIPCVKVYETGEILAFLDIAPAAPGHVVIVPKAHYPTLLDVPEELGSALLGAVKRVGRASLEALGATGFNVAINTFESAGQVVFHAHLHVIPRQSGDGLSPWTGKPYDSNETMARLAASIRSRIAL
jgi:histidine triad (HIT) family protein